MYLLDTNVIAESRRVGSGKGDVRVAAWLGETKDAAAFLSAMTVFEIEHGILLLARKDKRQGAVLRAWMDHTVLPAFSSRILPMSCEIALRCAGLHVPDPRSERDAWIAATALVHNLTVVTRNVADFQSAGVPLLNPWEFGA